MFTSFGLAMGRRFRRFWRASRSVSRLPGWFWRDCARSGL
jgi:hypothetical protein